MILMQNKQGWKAAGNDLFLQNRVLKRADLKKDNGVLKLKNLEDGQELESVIKISSKLLIIILIILIQDMGAI